jgi:pimeloyl-ACP methyl ester carboxylesterase
LIKNTQDLEFRRHDVDFPSCGATLRGQLLVPKTDGPHAAIAMAPGMSGVKEGSIMKFAEFFASGGFAVLAYDNINFGSSGGEPRQEVDPVLQRRGYRDAITFLTLRPEIDEERIGIFGTSYSGGHVLEVAAHDRRVKCVVSQIPAISGFEAFRRSARPDARAAVLRTQNKDRESRFLGLEPAMVIDRQTRLIVSYLILDLASPKSRNIRVDDARVLTETAPNIRSRDSAPSIASSSFEPVIGEDHGPSQSFFRWRGRHLDVERFVEQPVRRRGGRRPG